MDTTIVIDPKPFKKIIKAAITAASKPKDLTPVLEGGILYLLPGNEDRARLHITSTDRYLLLNASIEVGLLTELQEVEFFKMQLTGPQLQSLLKQLPNQGRVYLVYEAGKLTLRIPDGPSTTLTENLDSAYPKIWSMMCTHEGQEPLESNRSDIFAYSPAGVERLFKIFREVGFDTVFGEPYVAGQPQLYEGESHKENIELSIVYMSMRVTHYNKFEFTPPLPPLS